MKKGTAKWFSGAWGFIAPEGGGNDVFVHESKIACDGFRSLEKGEAVEYESEMTAKGEAATKVVRVTKK